MRPQEAVRQCFVLTQKTEKQMLGLDIRRPKLTGFIAGKEDHPPRLLRIAFEHVPPSSRPPRVPEGHMRSHWSQSHSRQFAQNTQAAANRRSIHTTTNSVSVPPLQAKPRRSLPIPYINEYWTGHV